MSIWSAIGSIADTGVSIWNADRNRRDQERFAKQGIRWRVADAKKAGIHPLYALGANTHSASPVSVGSSLGAAGQNIDRALDAGRTKGQQLQQRLLKTQIDGQEIENQLKASELARLQQSPSNALPGDDSGISPDILGRAPVPRVEITPVRVGANARGRAAQEAGSVTSFGFARTADGGLVAVPSRDMKDRIEDNIFLETEWAFRNQLMPFVSSDKARAMAPTTKDYPLPRGFKWVYDRWKAAWYPKPSAKWTIEPRLNK